MLLRQSSRDIIKLVEEQTGFPVQVLDDPKLPTMATVRIARGNLPAHVITYKPVTGEQPDYLIAYQCGFILRHFANPPHLRFDIGNIGVQAQAKEFVEKLKPTAADEIQVKVSLKSTGELGNFAVGSVGVEAVYEVTLKWIKEERKK